MSRFFRVPVKEGTLDINYRDLIRGKANDDGIGYVEVKDSPAICGTWEEISADEFEANWPIEALNAAIPVTNEEIKANQLVLMAALAELYETIGGE